MSQNSLNKSFGKVAFQILAKIEMMRNKNRHFERAQDFITDYCFFVFFFQNYDFL